MASYIELSKNTTLPSASSAGKASVGLNNDGSIVVSGNNGTPTILPSIPTTDHTSYVAKLTQNASTIITSGTPFITGSIYRIQSYNGGGDFSNIAYVLEGTINTAGCIFIATGTTPTGWGSTDIDQLLPPSSSIIENTLGFTPEWKTLDLNTYYFNFSQSLDTNKIIPFLSPNITIDQKTSDKFPFVVVNPTGYQYRDYSFNSPSDDYVISTLTQPDGKILVGGPFLSIGGGNIAHLARLEANGNIDVSFNTGSIINDNVQSISLQHDNKIIIGGQFTLGGRYGLARVDSTGSLDTSFNNGGSGFGDYVWTTAIQPDGKILVSAVSNIYNGDTVPYGIMRVNLNGTWDTSFNNGGNGVSYGNTYAIALQSDGKILVGGTFEQYNGISVPTGSIRLDSTGSLDTSFNNGGSGFNGIVYSLVIQPDGKILVGGNFNTYNGAGVSSGLIRLDSTGSLDTSFNSGGNGFNTGANINSILLQSDGSMIVGGLYGTYNEINANCIIKLDSSGSIINTFEGANSFDDEIATISSLSDQKIVVGGYFNQYNQQTANAIIGLNTAYDVVVRAPSSSNSYLYKTPIEVKLFN
jgi:uncharacterized delta-60 repeat protein